MAQSLARPKRAAEEYVRTHQDDSSTNGLAKKPRFDVRNPSALAPDALEDDATLEADVIGGRGQQVRRNAVNIDGYDSDSENEGFDGRANAKAKEKQAKSRLEEENDMFADLEEDFKDGDNSEEGDNAGVKKKKKAVRFLEADEIEGQIHSSKSGGHVSADFTIDGNANGKGKGKASEDNEKESSSDSEVDDEIRAEIGEDIDEEVGAGGKKKHAPKLDAFNMRNENEEGRFDDQGNFVRKAADPDAVHDIWLEGLSKKDMKKAKEAAEKREEERRMRDLADDAISTSDILKTLIPLLERGETVLEALARLGKGKKDKKRAKWQPKNRKKQKDTLGDDDETMGEADTTDPAEERRKQAVEAITGAADQLLTRGQTDIYDAERELLVRQYRRETGDEFVEPAKEAREDDEAEGGGGGGGDSGGQKMWEYRWSDARDGGEVHGPYDGATMVQWRDAGYFGEGVEFRLQSHPNGAWSRVVDFV